jgi:hypothetical protein
MVRMTLQWMAVAVLVVIYSMILHKGYTDISALAEKHSGEQFWKALGRYVIGNIGGGGNPGR